MNEVFELYRVNYSRDRHTKGWQLSIDQMYRDYVSNTIGSIGVQVVDSKHIEQVLREALSSGRKPSTVNRIRALLSGLLDFAKVQERLISENPVEWVRPYREIPKAAKPLTSDQAQALIDWAKTQHLGISILLSLYLGLREGEVIGLCWKNVDLCRHVVTVSQKFNKKVGELEGFTKSKKPRDIGIPEDLERILISMRPLHSDDHFVVSDGNGAMVSPSRIRCLFKKGARYIDQPNLRFHDLRHTFATQFTANRGALQVLKSVMGHSSMSVTEGYAHTRDEQLIEESKAVRYATASAKFPPNDHKEGLRLIRGGLCK